MIAQIRCVFPLYKIWNTNDAKLYYTLKISSLFIFFFFLLPNPYFLISTHRERTPSPPPCPKFGVFTLDTRCRVTRYILSWNNLFLLSLSSSGYPTLPRLSRRGADVDLIRQEAGERRARPSNEIFLAITFTAGWPRQEEGQDRRTEEEGGVWSDCRQESQGWENCHHRDHCQPGRPVSKNKNNFLFLLRPDIVLPALELSRVKSLQCQCRSVKTSGCNNNVEDRIIKHSSEILIFYMVGWKA